MTKQASPSKKRRIVAEFHRIFDKGGKTKTMIYEDLAEKHGKKSSKTIQRWVGRSDKEAKVMTADLTNRLNHLQGQVRILASGDYSVDEDTEKIKRPEPIPEFSQDGRLLV